MNKNKPLDKEIELTWIDNKTKLGIFRVSDVRSAVELMKAHVGIVEGARKDLLVHTLKAKEVLDIIDFCFPIFKESKP